jgi:hypothetical protein
MALNRAAAVEECPDHKMVAGAFLLADRCEHQIINTEQVRSWSAQAPKTPSEPTRDDPPSPVQRANDTQPRFGASCCHLPKT